MRLAAGDSSSGRKMAVSGVDALRLPKMSIRVRTIPARPPEVWLLSVDDPVGIQSGIRIRERFSLLPYALLVMASDIAGAAFILPMIVLAAVGMSGSPSLARAWLIAVCGALGATLIAKLVVIPCGHLVPGLTLRSPSGHAAGATAVYLGLAALVWRSRTMLALRALFVALMAGLCALVFVSRVALRAHTIEEVVLGAAIGAIAPLVLLRVPRPMPERPWRWLVLVPAILLLLAASELAYPVRYSPEGILTRFAKQWAIDLGACGLRG